MRTTAQPVPAGADQLGRQPRPAGTARAGRRPRIATEVGEIDSGIVATSPRAAVEDGARLPVRVAYAALAWVVLFFAFHVYWYLGGPFASPFASGKLPALVPDSAGGWIFAVLEGPAWPLGAWVCLAIARGWARGPLARAAAALVWVGCGILLLRGASGLMDDLTRATGLLANGISGISTESATGMTHVTVSYWAIETYFLAGGIIFGLLGRRYRRARSEAGQGVSPWTSS